MAAQDARLAEDVNRAVHEDVVASTRRSYDSVTKKYVEFCEVRGLRPFPVDDITLAGWILVLCTSVKVSSLKVYLAGVKHSQVSMTMDPWRLDGSEVIRRVMRYVKRRYGDAAQGIKTPVTLAAVAAMCCRLRGWPVPEDMSHDDRLFVVASLLGVTGCLRGGEFLWSTKSSRDVLLSSMVRVVEYAGQQVVELAIPRPKAKWWLLEEPVRCFSSRDHPLFDAVYWLREYRRFSLVDLAPSYRLFVCAMARCYCGISWSGGRKPC